jgi:hypothetical protein
MLVYVGVAEGLLKRFVNAFARDEREGKERRSLSLIAGFHPLSL